MCVENDTEKERKGDNMSALSERVFEVKPDKTNDFIRMLKKPMINKQFLEECKKASDSIKDSKKRK